MDPWQNVKTINDFNADEIISALQKEIRRGEEENAIFLALEMVKTSDSLEKYLWQRLIIISVEDVGFGDVFAPVLIKTLKDTVEALDSKNLERELFAVHAVRYLSACKKDRTTDEMLNLLNRFTEQTDKLPSIPNYAIDMHTKKGIQEGKDFNHFLNEGATILNVSDQYNEKYKQKIIEILNKI
jgi:replication-associated recombination protein RarA